MARVARYRAAVFVLKREYSLRPTQLPAPWSATTRNQRGTEGSAVGELSEAVRVVDGEEKRARMLCRPSFAVLGRREEVNEVAEALDHVRVELRLGEEERDDRVWRSWRWATTASTWTGARSRP